MEKIFILEHIFENDHEEENIKFIGVFQLWKMQLVQLINWKIYQDLKTTLWNALNLTPAR